MAKLIDADEAKFEIIAFATSCNSQILPIDAILMILNQIDTVDTVPVVRRRDCKHLMFSDCYGECGKGHMSIVSPDDFCSYGERKGGDWNE